MIFRNLKTGNTLVVENKDVIEVMASSPNYEKVVEKRKKGSDKADNTSETTPETTPEENPTES